MKKIVFLFFAMLSISLTSCASDYKSDQVSFYDVPLVCGASSSIGCGSRSKPLLMELEQNNQIKEAWLNRRGTIIAIVWEDNASETMVRAGAAKPLFAKYDVPFNEMKKKSDRTVQLETFAQNGKWYKGSNVDELSIEEAGIISEKIVSTYFNAKIITEDQAEKIKADVEAYFKTELVKVRTKENLYSDDTQAEWRKAIVEIGEKYLGKGNVPVIQVKNDKCEKDMENCKTKTNKQCCKK